jgi:hypothetical protein
MLSRHTLTLLHTTTMPMATLLTPMATLWIALKSASMGLKLTRNSLCSDSKSSSASKCAVDGASIVSVSALSCLYAAAAVTGATTTATALQ